MSTAAAFETGSIPDEYLQLARRIDTGGHRVTSIDAIDYEFADAERGLKTIYVGTREDGTVATFETGSFFDNGHVEGVSDKHDICVSTAGGCTRSCKFCSVPLSDLGFERLLTAGEMVMQVAHSVALRNPNGSMPNVVGMMGNGEPPDNPALVPALVALDASRIVDRVTLSTIGENIRGIGVLATTAAGLAMPVKLQVSIHAADGEKRQLIIPGKKTLGQVMAAADNWFEQTSQPVKLNVVLMKGVGNYEGFTNAGVEDAKKLAALVLAPNPMTGEQIPRRLKLSAFNPIPGVEFTRPDEETRLAFVETLHAEGITEIKTFRGSGIDIDMIQGTGGFACGALRATTAERIRLLQIGGVGPGDTVVT